MAGPETVGTEPVIKVDVRHIETLVKAAAMERAVLVLAGTMEVERFPVDQELGALNADLADAKGLVIDIPAEMDAGIVQVGSARPGLPEVWLTDLEMALSPGGGGDFLAVGIKHVKGDLSGADGFDAIADVAGKRGEDGDILNVGKRG